MENRYHLLTTVEFHHTYFANNSYNGFTIVPDAATQHHFKRLSLIFRALPNGLSILYETNAGLNRTREDILNEPLTFGFTITNSDADFLSYTDNIPTDISEAVLYLHNNINGTTDGIGLLHPGDFVSVVDILQNKAPDEKNPNNKEFFSKPFAWLEIKLHKGLEPVLRANFKGKETLWRYIINSDHLQDLSEPAVIHKDTKEAFTGPVWVLLPDGKRLMAFESKSTIPLCSKPEKVFQLVENYQPEIGKYKVVLGILPNPNVKQISLIYSEDSKQKNIFSEIFI